MYPFHSQLDATFSAFLCTFLVISVFKKALKPRAAGLTDVQEVMCLTDKPPVQLSLAQAQDAELWASEFSAHESTMQ